MVHMKAMIVLNNSFTNYNFYFVFEGENIRKHLKIISMEEFIRREGGENGRFPLPPQARKKITRVSNNCVRKKRSKYLNSALLFLVFLVVCSLTIIFLQSPKMICLVIFCMVSCEMLVTIRN